MMGRVTQGVKLINLKDDNIVSSISVINRNEEENEADEELIHIEKEDINIYNMDANNLD